MSIAVVTGKEVPKWMKGTRDRRMSRAAFGEVLEPNVKYWLFRELEGMVGTSKRGVVSRVGSMLAWGCVISDMELGEVARGRGGT